MDDGSDGSIPPSDGDLDTPEQVAKIENDIKRRWYLPAESSNEYSITARWRRRATKYKRLAGKVQKWSQMKKRLPTANAKLFAPYFAPGSKGNCAINSCKKSTVCKAVATLKASYESFIDKKKKHAAAKEKHAAAKEEHTAAANQFLPIGPSDQNDRSFLEMMAHLVYRAAGVFADNRKLVAAAAIIVAAKADLVAAAANNVANIADFVVAAANSVAKDAKLVANETKAVFVGHREVVSYLDALAAAAGNDVLLTTTENKNQEPKSSNVGGKKSTDATSNHPSSNYAALCEPEVIELSECDFLPNLQGDDAKLLYRLYGRLKDSFGKASRLEGGKDNAKYRQQCIETTVKGVMQVDVLKRMKQSKTKFYTPCCEGQENDGVQPILYAIMVKMVQVLGLGKHVTHEPTIKKRGNGVIHRVDFVVTLAEEYIYAILPAMLGVPIEVNPITRKNSNVDKLLLGAQNQVIGRLAKRAISSFGLGGIGEDCKVFGLELNMGSVSVIVLELSGVGTADVKVTTQRTKRMPLFDKETREKIFGQNAKDVEASLETEEQKGMPAGFCLLARTLMSVQHELGTSLVSNSKGDDRGLPMRSKNSDVTSSIEFGQFLGSGAFSHVLEVKNVVEGTNNVDVLEIGKVVQGYSNVDIFIKVPKSHELRKSLEKEAEVLQHLSQHRHIPQLYDPDDPIKILDFEIRCEISKLPCLLLRGLIGKPTSQRKDAWGNKDLEEICLKVYDALKHAHKKGWAHLDVRPANIIARAKLDDRPPGDRLEVMLIDWGCAYRNDKKVKGFVGCLPYAHDELFGPSKEWQPRLDHDLASLAYSVISLSLGSIPWAGYLNHLSVTDHYMKRRHEMASATLEGSFNEWRALSREVKWELLNAIGTHGKRKMKRKRQ